MELCFRIGFWVFPPATEVFAQGGAALGRKPQPPRFIAPVNAYPACGISAHLQHYDQPANLRGHFFWIVGNSETIPPTDDPNLASSSRKTGLSETTPNSRRHLQCRSYEHPLGCSVAGREKYFLHPACERSGVGMRDEFGMTR
jgi:hypothetical protein